MMLPNIITKINSFMREVSPLICCANQWTGFYMIKAFAMKELRQPGYEKIVKTSEDYLI